MRFYLAFPLLAIAVNARPQETVTSTSWKPIENESQTQHLRTDNHETRTYKTDSNLALKESVKQLTNQLTNINTTADFTMDTRTPPKIKFQQKNLEKKKAEELENSHPGVAVPIDVESFYESSTQKRPTINRNENKTPTPVSGISTWILLSGQSTTLKPVRKQPTIKTTTTSTTTEHPVNKTTHITEKPVKATIKVKPLTTRKPKTTTPLPSTTISAKTTSTTVKTTTTTTDKSNRLVTKIKASVLNNAVKNKTTLPSTIAVPTTLAFKKKTTEKPMEITTKTNNKISNNTETNDLQLEAKDGGLELPEEKSTLTTKRPRRPTTNKKKKNSNNKNRRRKPTNTTASEKTATEEDNNTKIAVKEKPIGTQIYNYLSREIMPTVGVGLVGLVVTAGLASYFLYPFGGLRRAYDAATDRKDYYYDEYAAGGMREEELIGKVIAGMPEHTDYLGSSQRTHLGRKDNYKNEVHYNYRNSDPYYPYPNNNDFKTVSVGSKIGYGRDVIAEHQKESGYTVDEGKLENQFVVGNIPKEFEPTLDPVPEHGPRSLRVRRFAQNDQENEIIDFKYEVKTDKIKYPEVTIQPYYRQKVKTSETITSTEKTTTEDQELSTTEETILLQAEQPNFFSFLRNLIELKVRIGLDLLLKTTDTFSRYLRGVQERVNTVLNNQNNKTHPR